MSAPWAILAALTLLQAVQPQGESAPGGALAGIVLHDETGAPVPNAAVHAIGPATRRLTTTVSGLDGRWRMRGMPEGVYRMIVVAPGFAPAWVEQGVPSNSPPGLAEWGRGIPLGPGQARNDLLARLVRAGSISGRVTNGAGVPIPDVVVTIDRAPVMGVPRIGQALTGRDGRYHLDGVAAGQRQVVVLPNRTPSSRAPDRGWARFYYPGTTNRSEARTVTVRAGERAGDIDIVVLLPSSHVITGQLAAPAGAVDAHVRLMSNGGRTLRNLSYRPGNGLIGPDIVEGGRHIVWARARDGDVTLAAWQVVDIAGDDALPPMALARTGVMRGRIRAASGVHVPAADLVVGSVLWIDGDEVDVIGERTAAVGADGSFELRDVHGPRRLYVRGLPRDWDIVDVRVAGASVLTAGIDVGAAEVVDGIEVIVGRRQANSGSGHELESGAHMS